MAKAKKPRKADRKLSRRAPARASKAARAKAPARVGRRPEPQGSPLVVLTRNPAVAKAVKGVAPEAAVLTSPSMLDKAITTGARVAWIDVDLPGGENCYELLRMLRMRSKVRLALLHPKASRLDASLLALARFAGADCVLGSPPSPKEMREFLQPRRTNGEETLATNRDAALSGAAGERILHDLANPHDPALLDVISDPETRLYSSSYGAYALDVEFKRASRFAMPLSVAIVGFEGEASTQVLLEIAAIFLNEIRDTDMLARFGINSFLFVMPNTLGDGARVMLERIAKSVSTRRLKDIVGDPVQLCSGVATLSMPSQESRDDLFQRAQRAFEKARAQSKPAVVAS